MKREALMERKNVGILIFNDVEVLDFCGPFEVFSVTRIDEEKRRDEPSPFNVFLVAETCEMVQAAGGMKIKPDYALNDCPSLDILVVPGGWGTRREMDNAGLIDWLSVRAAQTGILASVCTGALLLGKAGLLDGKRATTHWRSLDLLQSLCPQASVEKQMHYVEDGDLFTSAGISAGIDLSLKVVTRCFGEAVGRATARHMEYPFPEDYARRIRIDG